MQQVLYIHGGDVFETREELLQFLKDRKLDDPTVEPQKMWGKRLGEDLGNNFQVIAPSMPNKWNATYEEWSIWMEKHVPYLKNDCIIIGCSLGANFIAKYLAEHELPIRIASLHLVAGCFGAPNGFSLDEAPLGRLCAIPSITIYHSSDDTVVPVKDAEKYVAQIPCATLVLLNGRGHFLQKEFPELLERLRKQ
ncbi:MAG TPA: alpha/beta hydrolase [Candidatus Paceibacterota bacterium]